MPDLPTERRNLAIPALAFASGVVVTVEFIVVALLPLLAHALAVSLEQAGWLISAFALAAALIGPFATLLVARWQPRLVLTLSLLLFGVSSLVAALVPNFETMLVARLVQGAILTPFISVASAAAASMAGNNAAGQAIARVNLGVVVGSVLAVPAGVALADLFGWRVLFGGLGLFALVGAGFTLKTVPQIAATLPASLPEQAEIVRDVRFLTHLLLSTLLFAAMFASYSYIAAFLEDLAGWSGSGLALALVGFGLAGIAGNWIASRVVDREPTVLTVLVTLILVLATAALSLAGGSVGPTVVLLAIWGAAHTAAFVACQVRVMFAAPDAQAFAASLNISVCNIGIAAGTLLGGWVIARFGIAMIGLGTTAVGFIALLVGAFLYRSSALCERECQREADAPPRKVSNEAPSNGAGSNASGVPGRSLRHPSPKQPYR